MIAEGALPHAVFLAVYLLALLVVGAWKARRVRTQEDFSLAGRGLSTFVLVGTLLATWIGTGSVFGNAQKTYQAGVPAFLLPVASLAGIAVLLGIAPRLRRFGQFTLQDVLEARFGPLARVLGTLTLLLAYTIIVSYQLRAGASVLEGLAPGLGHAAAVWAVAAFVVLYTALAGMISVAYTDVANGLLMTLGLALALPLLASAAGGFGTAVASLEPGQRELLGGFSATHTASILLPALLLVLGDANLVQRFFSARTPAGARRAAIGMLLGVAALECAIIAVALLGRALVAQGALEAPGHPGEIVVHVALHALPPALGALLVATVVAVVVSTADSYLLAPATSLVRDVWQRFLRPAAPEREIVLVGRVVVVGLGLAAVGLAFSSDTFFEVALFAYTIYGAGITPALLAAYFWRRATPAGAVASIATGVGCALAWRALAEEGVRAGLADAGLEPLAALGAWGARHEVDAVLPAVLVSVVVLVAVSLAGRPPDPARARAFR